MSKSWRDLLIKLAMKGVKVSGFSAVETAQEKAICDYFHEQLDVMVKQQLERDSQIAELEVE